MFLLILRVLLIFWACEVNGINFSKESLSSLNLNIGMKFQQWPKVISIVTHLCRTRVPHHNFWFQKLVQLVAQAFKKLIQRRRLTTKSRWHLTVALIWKHRRFPFYVSHFRARFLTEFTPIVFSKRNPLFSDESVRDPVYHQKGYKS